MKRYVRCVALAPEMHRIVPYISAFRRKSKCRGMSMALSGLSRAQCFSGFALP